MNQARDCSSSIEATFSRGSYFRAAGVCLILAVMALAACGPRTQMIRLDPMEFTASQTPAGIEVDLMDPEVLFIEGVRAYDEKRHDEAIRKFGHILERFPDSRFARPALFNRGLALLAAERPSQAAPDFRAYIDQHEDDPDVGDAWQRLGQSLQEAGEWRAAEEALKRRLQIQPLPLSLEVEMRARLARTLRMQERIEETRGEVDRVMDLHDRHATLPEMQGNYFVAMASFEGAGTVHDLFARIKFILPTERMEKDLTDKATLFLKAQAEYLRTARLRNVYWGVQAGIKVGRMYEEFYNDIMTAETPPDFSPEDLQIYMDELRKKARPLVTKAVDAYERNLSLARMYGARDEWFGDMADRLARLRKMLSEIPKAETP
jgi:tetratricopeptide (TPR) repeat protein